jgi:hypothetical protein
MRFGKPIADSRARQQCFRLDRRPDL